jgi:hypothetical protein
VSIFLKGFPPPARKIRGRVKKIGDLGTMAVAAPGWCIPYWWSQQNGGRLQFVSNSCFAAAVKTSGSDFVEVNKIGRDHLAGGEVHRMFTFASPETAFWGKR